MPFQKGKSGNNRGRPKGVANKLTTTAKESFLAAFEDLGGYAAMVEWAGRSDENLKTFYTLYARLIPTDVTSGGKEIPAPVVQVLPPTHAGQ